MSDNTIPHFLNLIKDAKRMSIVFETEEHIECYLRKLKTIFGQD